MERQFANQQAISADRAMLFNTIQDIKLQPIGLKNLFKFRKHDTGP